VYGQAHVFASGAEIGAEFRNRQQFSKQRKAATAAFPQYEPILSL
jgi:hypothetical protein